MLNGGQLLTYMVVKTVLLAYTKKHESDLEKLRMTACKCKQIILAKFFVNELLMKVIVQRLGTN